jgi:hypothetical protein
LKNAAHRGEQKAAAQHEKEGHGNGPRDSAVPEIVAAHERQHGPMDQRQPHGAHLLVARGLGIHHAAGDIQVALGVAVIEEPAAPMEEEDRRGAPQGEHKPA